MQFHRIGRRLVIVPCVAVLFAAHPAFADDPVDTVFLKNGGRLRGVVLEQSPTTGVTIRLIDGKTRKLKPAEVAKVEFDEPAPGPLAPPPVAPPPAPAPVFVAPPVTPVGIPPISESAEGGEVRLRGIEIALSVFEASAFGDAQSNVPIDSGFSATWGLGLDVGYRIDNHFYVGIFARVEGITGSVAGGEVGGVARFHFRPVETFDPWVGLGGSFEDSGATSGADGYEGWNLHVQAGLDIKPTHWFALGPFVDLSAGQYTSAASGETFTAAFHEWFVIGARSDFDTRF